MADLSKIKLNGTTYNFKDTEARNNIPTLTSDLTNDSGFLTGPKIYYGVCDTAGGTRTKTVTVDSSFELVAGVAVTIKFTNAPLYQGQPFSLNVNGTGTKTIVSYGTNSTLTPGDASWYAGGVVTFVYDGTNWVYEGWQGTTYSTIFTSEMGTNNTVGRLITGQRLLQIITGESGGINYDNTAFYATTDHPGVMSVADKTKLDGLTQYNDAALAGRVSDLEGAGYQTSSQVQTAINTAIGDINSFEVAVVSALPTENIDDHTIYFVPQAVNSSVHDEYMYINNTWELIGTTSVDLSSYLQTSDIADWAKAASKPSYTAAEVGALPSTYTAPVTSVNGQTGVVSLSIPTVPTNVSEFNNDAGYLTSYTETDPTVPAWAKATNKPSYTAAEVGAMATSHAANAITSTDISNWNAKSDFSGSYNDLSDKPTIPAATTVTQTLTSGTKIGEVNSTSLYAPNAYDDTALAARVTALENIPWVTYYTGTSAPNSTQGNNGDIYLQTQA